MWSRRTLLIVFIVCITIIVSRLYLSEMRNTKPFACDLGNILCENLAKLNNAIVGRLEKFLPPPTSAFAAGLLVGARSQMPRNIIEEFRRTGLSHTIAISGFNMVLIVNAVALLLSWLPRRIAIVVTLILMGFFTILVGASGAVIRAYVMSSLALVARFFRRPNASARGLITTVLILLMISPGLVFDIGFQLSVGATAALLIFSRPCYERLSWLPERFGLRETLATTLAVEIITVPIIFFHFRTFSLIAPLANVLVVPLIPFLMLGSGFSLILGKLAAAPTFLLFKFTLWIIHILANVPLGWVEM